ncbi:hypothetical protein CHX27_06025 [Flavobacterium aurantiibacter]|uniref:Uncharacterized protein n=1 Tax=Flavobacterium aurantiibacter TaxID=2023067 RepID=A0A255ZVG6_9FLAO|nr:hypothetical protein CHX27_06025 [Flavobacterium aurantiibacter]
MNFNFLGVPALFRSCTASPIRRCAYRIKVNKLFEAPSRHSLYLFCLDSSGKFVAPKDSVLNYK